jgi:hypothetical protein
VADARSIDGRLWVVEKWEHGQWRFCNVSTMLDSMRRLARDLRARFHRRYRVSEYRRVERIRKPRATA